MSQHRGWSVEPDCHAVSYCVPCHKNFNRLHSYSAKLEEINAGADNVVMLDEHGYLT